uniref:Uncharacterized protein n=1 Tax=Ananas comosus var. bracteatus TaxID=296719 RepID=A0A6V7PLK8_ANACO|nr:unnamed protein product [Ananas comosus var. bracteatus]
MFIVAPEAQPLNSCSIFLLLLTVKDKDMGEVREYLSDCRHCCPGELTMILYHHRDQKELAVDSHNKRHQRGTKSVTGNSPILATPKPFNYSDASQPSRTFKNPNQQERVLGAGPVSTEATRNISNTDFDERRAEGLCFWCEEKYVPGRQCKKKQLYRIELVEEENGGGLPPARAQDHRIPLKDGANPVNVRPIGAEEHLQHLRTAFDVLRQHTLFLKQK